MKRASLDYDSNLTGLGYALGFTEHCQNIRLHIII